MRKILIINIARTCVCRNEISTFLVTIRTNSKPFKEPSSLVCKSNEQLINDYNKIETSNIKYINIIDTLTKNMKKLENDLQM